MSFDPQNDLERSLLKAANDAAHRPQFYRDFLASNIFVIEHGVPTPEGHGRRTLQQGENIRLRNIEYHGKLHIPIFSSLDRLKVLLTEEAPYLEINALEFLKIARGTPVVLNPGSDYGKEFTESELASILDGSLWQPSASYVAQKPTQIMIGRPRNYPNELTETFSRLFSTIVEVKRAWLAHYFNPECDEKPHTLIAIEHLGKWEDIAGQAGIVANDVKVPDPPVDFIEVSNKETIEGSIQQYFLNEAQPFYKKKWFFGLFG